MFTRGGGKKCLFLSRGKLETDPETARVRLDGGPSEYLRKLRARSPAWGQYFCD